METKNGYNLEKQWWNFRLTTSEKVTSKHTELYWYMVRQNNSFGWVDVFGLPTDHTVNALKISYKTYKAVLTDLEKWGFITIVEKSYNQHYSNRITLNLLRQKLPKQLPKQVHHNKTIGNFKNSDIVKKININPIPEDAR
jgi:hypothetical protein